MILVDLLQLRIFRDPNKNWHMCVLLLHKLFSRLYAEVFLSTEMLMLLFILLKTNLQV